MKTAIVKEWVKQLDIKLRCMGTPPFFSTMFSKGDNFDDFLFAYLEVQLFL